MIVGVFLWLIVTIHLNGWEQNVCSIKLEKNMLCLIKIRSRIFHCFGKYVLSITLLKSR